MEVTEERLTLVRRKVAAYVAEFPGFYDVDVDAIASIIAGQLWYRIEGYVLGEELPPHTETRTQTVTVACPATWWQHFKQAYEGRWFARWFVRRFPVVMREKSETATLRVTWENMAAYPFARYRHSTPDYLGQAVRLSWITADYREGD